MPPLPMHNEEMGDEFDSPELSNSSVNLKLPLDRTVSSENKEETTFLKSLKLKNWNRLLIGSLNINSLEHKFEHLKVFLENTLDILVLNETKLSEEVNAGVLSYFGFHPPFRMDRNKNGGGVIVFVRSNIPCRLLQKHNFTKNVEGMFLEINLRKKKILLFAVYHSTHEVYGCGDIDFLDQLSLCFDVYSNYDRILCAGDFNIVETNTNFSEFLNTHNFSNLVKEPTCFKNPENPSCIDLFLTNSPKSFQNTCVVSTGLSDFHKMIVTVLKMALPKSKPIIRQYRDFKKKFDLNIFQQELNSRLNSIENLNYSSFERTFLEILNSTCPVKKKTVRANDKPYISQTLRKAIRRRSFLENRYFNSPSAEKLKELKKHKNYTSRLAKKTKREYFHRLDIGNICDNKKFWQEVTPLFSQKWNERKSIILLENNEIISNDKDVASIFSTFFKNAVDSLDLTNIDWIFSDTTGLSDPIEMAITKFKIHPSILAIQENYPIGNENEFSFSKIDTTYMEREIGCLNIKKSTPINNIPIKTLKECKRIVSLPLTNIWNDDILINCSFPNELKLADLAPLHKKSEQIFKINFRPVSILPVVSKLYEKIMHAQVGSFVSNKLSKHLCGYRKGFNTQYALLVMIEKWKKVIDKGGFAGTVLMDLSKAFDTINFELLIAKLKAYGFGKSSLRLILDYLSNRWQRVKVNGCFSSWEELLRGVPQGSILGPLIFNIYYNDIFLFLELVCNFADDTSPYACELSLPKVLEVLESNCLEATVWFTLNFLKLNAEKCHFLLAGNTEDFVHSVKVGSETILESQEEAEILLGVTIDKNLKFDAHILEIYKKASRNVSILSKIGPFFPKKRRIIVMKTYIESQFSYCPLIWMFCTREMNHKINHVHERALRIAYDDYNSSFQELLTRSESITIHQRNIHAIAVEMYKFKNGLSPEIMQEIISPYDGYDTRSGRAFLRPNVKKVFTGALSFSSFGPIVWNEMLPEKLRICENLDIFKTEVKKWIPDNCKCRLCQDYIAGVGFVNITE